MLSLLKQGDVAAYTELFDRFQPLLYVAACKIAGDEDEAADLVQEVFIKLWDKRESLSCEGPVLAYLSAAVRYKFFDLLSKKKVRANYASSMQAYIGRGVPLTDHYIREKEMLRIIEQQIALLPPKLRVVYELSRKANLSTAEIAEMTGVSEKTVKNQLSLAVKELRVKLGILCVPALSISTELFLELLKKI